MIYVRLRPIVSFPPTSYQVVVALTLPDRRLCGSNFMQFRFTCQVLDTCMSLIILAPSSTVRAKQEIQSSDLQAGTTPCEETFRTVGLIPTQPFSMAGTLPVNARRASLAVCLVKYDIVGHDNFGLTGFLTTEQAEAIRHIEKHLHDNPDF